MFSFLCTDYEPAESYPRFVFYNDQDHFNYGKKSGGKTAGYDSVFGVSVLF